MIRFLFITLNIYDYEMWVKRSLIHDDIGRYMSWASGAAAAGRGHARRHRPAARRQSSPARHGAARATARAPRRARRGRHHQVSIPHRTTARPPRLGPLLHPHRGPITHINTNHTCYTIYLLHFVIFIIFNLIRFKSNINYLNMR